MQLGGGGSGADSTTTSPDASLTSADATVQSAMKAYLTDGGRLRQAVEPRRVPRGGRPQARGQDPRLRQRARHRPRVHGAAADQTTTLNEAQTLANSLEILGDAQPTQANYNQVLNTFNVNSAITQLQGDVTALGGVARPVT